MALHDIDLRPVGHDGPAPWRVTCLGCSWQSISIQTITSYARLSEVVAHRWQSIATPSPLQEARVHGAFILRWLPSH